MATTIAKLSVAITGNSKGLTKAYGRALRSTKKFTAGMAQAAKRVAQIGIVAGGVAAAGLTVMMKRTFANIDAQAKLSDQLGISTEWIARLGFAADITGVGAAKMSGGLSVMTKRLGEAALGSGAAAKQLKVLGLDAEKMASQDLETTFFEIADAISKLDTQSAKAAATAGIFSRANLDLVNTLAAGEEGLRAMGREADALGLSVSRVDAAQIEIANDAFTRLGALLTGISNRLAVKIAPFVAEAVTQLVEWASEGDRVGQAMSSVFAAIETGILTVIQLSQDAAVGFLDIGIAALKMSREVVRDGLAPLFDRLNEMIALFNKVSGALGLSKIAQIGGNVAQDINIGLAEAEGRLIGMKSNLESINWAGQAQRQIDRVIADAQRRAEEIAAAVKTRGGGVGAQAKARRDAAELVKLQSEAKGIFDATRTPLEKYTARMSRLNLLLDQQVITQQTYDRALKDAKGDLESVGRAVEAVTGGVGAVERGSAGAASARARAANRPAQLIAKSQLTETKKSNSILERIDNGIRQVVIGQPATVTIGR